MGKVLIVETGAMGHAFSQTRFVPKAEPEKPKLPTLGDPWCTLTVRARLERMGATYRRLPHSHDTRAPNPDPKSCMPTPLRELFKDMPAAPLRPGVSDADIAAANNVIDVLTKDERGIAWAIANRTTDTDLGELMGRDRRTAAKEKQRVLGHLAAHWATLGWLPDAEDIRRARRFLHRNFE